MEQMFLIYKWLLSVMFVINEIGYRRSKSWDKLHDNNEIITYLVISEGFVNGIGINKTDKERRICLKPITDSPIT